MDALTGKTLYDKCAHELCLPACMTKILTTVVAIESGKLDETVTISEPYSSGQCIRVKTGRVVSDNPTFPRMVHKRRALQKTRENKSLY